MVTIARAQVTLSFPSTTILVAGMNPCQCGFYGDSTRECRCTGAMIQRYLGRISGPLLDRIDLHIEVPAVPYRELRGKDEGISSAEIRGRVERARAVQSARGFYNSRIPFASCASCACLTMRESGRSNWRSAAWDFRRARTIAS